MRMIVTTTATLVSQVILLDIGDSFAVEHTPLACPCVCSYFVLMPIQTLGEAWKLGWRVRVRCLVTGPAPKNRDRVSIYCETSAELEMKTLVWTRDDGFPLDQLAARLKCPRCGSRNIQVVFELPNQPKARAAR
jgi:Zn finger protein HypA/HybF involved in hydrogenase expression